MDLDLLGNALVSGLLFITEVALILGFGVDYRMLQAPSVGPDLHLGAVEPPLRLLVRRTRASC
jgi:branched-chain amino acid transport system permease protein